MDDEIIIGVTHPEKEMPKNKKKKATSKKVASKKNKKVDKNKPKKKQKTRSKKTTVILVIIVLLICGLVFLLFSNMFEIKNIEIKNNSRLSKEKIEEICDFDKYRNIFWVTNIGISKDLEKNAYVENVKIHKKLPDTLIIDIKERVPRYMLQIADSYVYINNQGYLLEVSTENIGLPIILGLKTDLSNVEAGKRLDVEDLKRLETIIKIMDTAAVHNIDNLITKIDISDDRNYTIILESEGKTVYLGDATDLNTRMIYLSGILNREKGVAGEIFLDMNLNTEDAFFREKI